MKDDSQLIADLRSQLDLLADRAPLINPHQPRPTTSSGHQTFRPSRRRRVIVATVALVVIAAATGLIAVIGTHRPRTTLVIGTPATVSHPSAPSSTGDSVLTWPDILPGPGATLKLIFVYENQAPISQTEIGDPYRGIYAQEFEGPGALSAPRLVVTTEAAPPHALVGYTRPPSHAVALKGGVGYLDTFPTHLQLLWQTSGGEVVSLESINLDSASLITIAERLSVVSGRPGVAVTEPLPDRLIQVGSGSAVDNELLSSNGSETTVGYTQDGCDADLNLLPGELADADAVAVSAGDGRDISVDGHPAIEITWPASEGGATRVIWVYRAGSDGHPGLLASLQGRCSDIPELASQLHTVDARTWERAIQSLGRNGTVLDGPASVTPSTLAPGQVSTEPETFGIAH
jgi:hypothetical protein